MMSLIFCPKPQQGESLQGFLLRLAEANFLSRPKEIMNVSSELHNLYPIIGKTLFGNVPHWFKKGADTIEFAGNLNQSYLLQQHARFCPECISQMAYWPAEWEHILYTACHQHGRRLLSYCPNCACKLTWMRRNLMVCHCGAPLASWPLGAKISDGEIQLLSELWRSLVSETGRKNQLTESSTNQLLRGITSDELSKLIFQFGAYKNRLIENAEKKGFPRIAHDKLHDFVLFTVNLLIDWPKQFHLFLEDMRRDFKSDDIHTELATDYLNFGKGIRTQFRSTGLKFVFNAYRSYVARNWHNALNHRNNWVKPRDFEKQRYVPAIVAAKSLHISRHKIKELIAGKILQGYVKQTPCEREFIFVERSSLANAKEILDEKITLSAAITCLGLPKSRVLELVNGGLITEIIRPGLKKNTRLFSRKEIAVFVKRLYAGNREPAEEELISGPVILKIHLATEKEFLGLIHGVLCKQVHPILALPHKKGFGALAFSRKEFYAWRANFRANSDHCFFTVVAAATELGLKQEVAYHLVRIGLLKSTCGKSGKRRCHQIALEDIQQFKSQYVSATELAAIAKTSPKSIIDVMMANQILPITGPTIDSGRQYFFRRSEVF